ncbi:hypothetical protein B0H17DRAFT_1210925 [Mycena rosella]|uniref:Uncharacterized protein n=1 Tax=Mycena rosella TaxID=1033263 RepID=A0AAD7CVQ8_MYCRO|nr:hypothetical protein B0H17DRAFT_1210925 [Mycena rosella]
MQATRKIYGDIASLLTPLSASYAAQCCASQARRCSRTQRRSTLVIRGPPASLILPADVVVHGDHAQATLAIMCIRIRAPPTILRTWRRVRSTFWQPRMRTPRRIRWSWCMCGFPTAERVARGRWARSRTEYLLELDGIPAHSVLSPSAPQIPRTLLQFRARAVFAAAQFRPVLPALESRPQTPRPRAPAEPIRRCSALFPLFPAPSTRTPEQPSAILAPLPAASPVPAPSFQDARRGAAPSTVCLHGELGYWHAAATASLREHSRPHERQVAPLQLCSVVTRRPCREFCGRRPGAACVARPRHIPADGAGHGSNCPPRPPPVSPPRLLSPMRSLSAPISAPPTKLLLRVLFP